MSWMRKLYRHGGSLCIAVPSEIVRVKRLHVGKHLIFTLDKDCNIELKEVIVDKKKH